MQKAAKLALSIVIVVVSMANLLAGVSTLIEQEVQAQNMTNASNFTGLGMTAVAVE